MQKSVTALFFYHTHIKQANLPLTVTQSSTTLATYTYDAGGNKLRNTGSDGTWDYVNGIVYQNNTIAFVSAEEGRAVPNGGGNYVYQYNLKDHLGNNRVSFYSNSGTATVLQEDEYYAFGLRRGLYDASNNNRYLYNGKEIQTDLSNQYDYGARFYDPVIGRWTSVDPLAEKYRRWSPYNYAVDNPVRFIDPNGMGVAGGPNDPWGKITISTNVGGNGGMLDGHAWITLTNNKGVQTTMSLWGNTGDQEFQINKEKDYSTVTSRTLNITEAQADKIVAYNSKAENVDWNVVNDCAGYSAGLWQSVTGENLNASNSFGFGVPANLAQSIFSQNGNNSSNVPASAAKAKTSTQSSQSSTANSSNSNSSSGSSTFGSSTSSSSSGSSAGGNSSSSGSVGESSYGGNSVGNNSSAAQINTVKTFINNGKKKEDN